MIRFSRRAWTTLGSLASAAVLLTASALQAQDRNGLNSQLVSARRLADHGVLLDRDWKVRFGDNPSWSLPTYDDADWANWDRDAAWPDSILSQARQLEAAGRPAIVWFRIRIQPERALIRKPLALSFTANGAAQVFVDSRRILDLGEFDKVGTDAAVLRAPLPTTILFDSASALLAVRYHLGTSLALPYDYQLPPAFTARLQPAEAVIQVAENKRLDGGITLALCGLFLAVGILHFVLYLLLRKPVSNLHYAAFASQFAIGWLLLYVSAGAASVRALIAFQILGNVAITLALLALLTFLYTHFYQRIPRIALLYYGLGAVGITMLLGYALGLIGSWGDPIGIIAVIAVIAECSRVIGIALWQKKEGARTIAIGFAVSFLGLAYALLVVLGLAPAPQHLDRWVMLGTLGLAFAPSLHLAYSFANVSKRLELRVRERTAALENLLNTMADLSGQLELSTLLQSVLERAVNLLGTSGGELAIVDDNTKELVVVANMRMTANTVGIRMREGDGAMGHAITNREQLVIPDYQKWEGRSNLYDGILSHAVVVSPLLIGDHPVGAIAVWHEDKSRQFSPEALNVLNAFAQQAAVAIENARLYTATQEQRQYFESVVRNSPVAIVTLDLEQKIESANPAFERLFGWSEQEIIGADLDSLVTDETTRHEAAAITTEAMDSTVHHMGRRRRKDGGWLEVEVLAVPVRVNGERRGLVALYHDITELTRARREAEAADQAKSQFLANMSHELRTPLNAVIGYSEMLMEEASDAGDEGYVPDLQKIHSSGRHLLGLINDILDLSKIEAGRMELYLETFDAAAMINEVATTIKPLVDKNSNTLALEVPADLGVVRLDQVKVRQILFNLLSNASKFTENGTITLSAERIDERVLLRIADTGIGMTPEQMTKLFQPFTQADASTTKKYGGTGLGLVISRHFCEMMGGSIELQSEPERGTIFTVSLPRDAEVFTQAEERTAATQPDERGEGVMGTVLVIDDDAVARDMFARMLGKEGYRVLGAASGEEGLRMARDEQPDVITLDVLMAGLDGWGVLTRLKADPATVGIPVVVVTVTDDRNLGYALGAADYLTKPIDRERLGDALRRVRAEPKSGPVLVVDDDPTIREMLRRMLEKDGWGVVEAENGRVALDAMLQHTPSVVLLDLMMPEMDGFTFIDEIRHRGAVSLAPIIVLTAKTLTEAERARLQGAVTRIMQKGEHAPSELINEIRHTITHVKVSSYA